MSPHIEIPARYSSTVTWHEVQGLPGPSFIQRLLLAGEAHPEWHGWDPELIEIAKAHVNKYELRSAYNRADYIINCAASAWSTPMTQAMRITAGTPSSIIGFNSLPHEFGYRGTYQQKGRRKTHRSSDKRAEQGSLSNIWMPLVLS